MGRKHHVRATVEQAVQVVERSVIASPTHVAEALGCSVSTARRKLDGGLARGVLIRDDYDADGQPLQATHWRYGLNG